MCDIDPIAAGTDWFQLVIEDPRGLSGSSVFDFVDPLISRFGIATVIVSDIEGSVLGFTDVERVVLSATEFLKRVSQATQYDWGFFFLFSTRPAPDSDWSDDQRCMQLADITIRLADNTYFYVYSRDELTIATLRLEYPQAEVKVLKFAALEVPY